MNTAAHGERGCAPWPRARGSFRRSATSARAAASGTAGRAPRQPSLATSNVCAGLMTLGATGIDAPLCSPRRTVTCTSCDLQWRMGCASTAVLLPPLLSTVTSTRCAGCVTRVHAAGMEACAAQLPSEATCTCWRSLSSAGAPRARMRARSPRERASSRPSNFCARTVSSGTLACAISLLSMATLRCCSGHATTAAPGARRLALRRQREATSSF
mmetsp:Transcript_6573/g.16836  ORF Transcript_6573/g.16836 Transcript_6573/m.16836 type:complete len:214 (-) Transcript_6573:524-1165(-)